VGPATPRRLTLISVVLASVVLLCVSVAGARTTTQTPTITGISPATLRIKDKLKIRGRGFLPGKFKNTVVFLRARTRPLFVRADNATSTGITLTIPDKLLGFLANRGGTPVATRFQLRVLSRRFGLAFTPRRLSPVIGPATSGSTVPVSNCKPDFSPGSTKDSDGDGLPDVLEKQIGTDPCKTDTDGDGIPDGYEYYAALDLNGKARPYPGKRPYPNPLDPTDANTDYDGDGLTMKDEYSAWVRYGDGKFPLTSYSDGTQNTGGPQAIPPGKAYLDLNGDGTLSDDERDVDNDGLGNWVEAHGPLSGQAWWTSMYKTEPAYGVNFAGTDWLDPDTNGDGVPDGLDDQDHDGYNNIQETSRGPYWVNPFNPCLPDPHSRTCSLHPPVDNPWPPFDHYSPSESIPLVWPRPSGP
jgi:hypothetical protein